MSSSLRLHPHHCRQLKFCMNGVREFYRRNDLDYSEFVFHGTDLKVLTEKLPDDHFVQRAVQLLQELEDGR